METALSMRMLLLILSVGLSVSQTPACNDPSPFSGVLRPCSGDSCTLTTETCAQLESLGGCVKTFGAIFEFASGPPLGGGGRILNNNTLIAPVCVKSCNVCGMSEPDIRANVQLFQEFDTNHDGTIEGSELKALLHVSGVDLNDTQLSEVLAKDDTNGDGRVDFPEFTNLTKTHPGAATAAASNPGAQLGTCHEAPTNVGGQIIRCADYIRRGYTCERLAQVVGFEQEVDCHCSCPAGAIGSSSTPVPRCNMAYVQTACADPSIITPQHLCDNICSDYLIDNWQVCSHDPHMDKALIRTFDQVIVYCARMAAAGTGK